MSDAGIKNVLTIAGLDPSGGAGILADVKTMSALGTYAMAAVTALTAQNTQEVRSVQSADQQFLREEIDTLFSDIRIDAVKIGMLSDAETVMTVSELVRKWRPRWVVLDPVMVAKSGDRLLRSDAIGTLIRELLPLVHIVTPNLPEAEALLGEKIESLEAMKESARALFALSNNHAFVYLKGGHLDGNLCSDVFYDGKEIHIFSSNRITTKNTHGTGCSLSSAIAANLAKTAEPLRAVEEAKKYLTEAIAASDDLCVGHGHGPVHHFVNLWDRR